MGRSTRPHLRWLSAAGLAAAGLLCAGAAVAQGASSGDSLGTLMSIGLQDLDGRMVLEFAASQRPQCADFTVADPPTLTLMCDGMTMGTVPPSQDVGNGVVERIEVSESSDIEGTSTQIKIYLSSMIEYDKQISGEALTLVLKRPGAAEPARRDAIAEAMEDAVEPAAEGGDGASLSISSTRTGELSSVSGDHDFSGSGVQIRGVDFQNLRDVSRLVITGDRALRYTTTFPSDHQVVVALPNSILGTGLERRLDTSKFPSAVNSIASYRSRAVRGEVKVVVDLRDVVTPTFTEVDNALIIDFPIPPSVAGARYDAPSAVQSYEEPEPDDAIADTDEQLMESVTGRELLISGGKSLDPTKIKLRRRSSIFGGDSAMFLGEIDPSHVWKGRPINLNLVNANIHNVFRLLTAVSKVNIVTSDDVDGLVTVQLNEVPWDQAFAAILQSKSLGAVQYGNIVRVAPIETIRREKEAASAARASQREALPLSVLTQPLNYATAEDVMKQLDGMLSKRGSIAFDERTNALIIRDIAENLSQIRELVRALDTQTPQVLIEARIVEATSIFSRQLGVQWGGNLDFSPATGAPTGIFFPNSVQLSGARTASSIRPGGSINIGGRPTNFTTTPNYVVDLPAGAQNGAMALSLGSITGLAQLDLRLTAGESNGTTKIIAAPSITTVTNRPATIRDGARIPYETASLRGTTIQFVEATLLLQVTPQITQDNNIFLEIEITKNQPDFGASVRNFPSLKIKEASTTVMVGDGDTTVIGGVYTFEQAISKAMIPGLGRIPILGWLFKSTTKRVERKEMLVFITPSIIRAGRNKR